MRKADVTIEGFLRTMAHAVLLLGSLYIANHPEYAYVFPVFQYLGQAMDSTPRVTVE